MDIFAKFVKFFIVITVERQSEKKISTPRKVIHSFMRTNARMEETLSSAELLSR